MIRISVKEAASLLNVSEQMVRIGITRKTLPIGFYTVCNHRKTYVIYKELVEKVAMGVV